jgi:4a-hydroxytetrahydrobiopterin dehydratase
MQVGDNWQVINFKLTREFAFDTFGRAMQFVNAVASLAEEVGHHPDIEIRYDRVRLCLFTHEAENEITSKDYELAQAIDKLTEISF